MAATVANAAMLGRYLGAAEFGQYAALFSLVALASLLTDFGLNIIVIREASTDPASLGPLIERGTPLRLLLGVGAAVVGVTYAAVAWRTPLFVGLVALTSVSVVLGGMSSLFSTVFNVRGEFGRLSLIRAAQALLSVVFTASAVFLDSGLPGVVVAQVLSVAVTALVMHRLAMARASFRLRTGAIDWTMARAAGWFGVSAAMTFTFGRVSVLLGATYLSPDALGHYAAAYGMAEQMSLLVANLVAVAFPALAPRILRREVSRAQLVVYSAVLLLIAIPIALVVLVIAAPILSLIYGAPFAAGATALQILAWTFPVAMATLPASMAADATNNQRVHAFNSVYMGAATMLLIVILAPSWGAPGLATAVLVGRALGFIVGTPLIFTLLHRQGLLAPRMRPCAEC